MPPKQLARFCKLLDEDIPLELYRLFPRADATYLVAPPARERVQRMRVCFHYADEQYLYVTPLHESIRPEKGWLYFPVIKDEHFRSVEDGKENSWPDGVRSHGNTRQWN